MRRRPVGTLALAVIALAGCARHREPGVVAPDDPRQEPVPAVATIPHAGVALVPLARFEVRARVLGSHRYVLGRESRLAPVDLALGWGPMSDSAVLDDVHVTQMARAYFWSTNDPPIPPEEISAHSANMHLIPATAAVARTIARARPGDVIALRGALVEAHAPDGWTWTSSLTRDDTGEGACELVWVEDARLE